MAQVNTDYRGFTSLYVVSLVDCMKFDKKKYNKMCKFQLNATLEFAEINTQQEEPIFYNPKK